MTRLDPKVIEEIAKEEPEYAAQLARDYRKAMIVLAREDPSWFCAYVLRNATDGSQIYQHPDHEALHKAIQECPRVAIWTHPGMGKALPLDTPVPTPRGWRTMGDLAVGDRVFDQHGYACTVTATTETQLNRPVYRLTFDDGTTCLADENHNWLATAVWDRHEHRGCRVITTGEMASGPLLRGGKRVWAIPVPGPVQYAQVELPVSPYTLGAWIGDGTSALPQITFHVDDRASYDRCAAEEGHAPDVRPIKGREHLARGHLTSPTFRERMRGLGFFLPESTKRIPASYLISSEQQRRDLLAGLLDTDGCISTNGLVEFCTKSQELAGQVLELVRSLGYKARLSSKTARCKGKTYGAAYYVRFIAKDTVFYLPRKIAKQAEFSRDRRTTEWRYLDRVEPVESVPVRCISVDSADRSFLFGHEYIVTHNCTVSGELVLFADGSWRAVETIQPGDKLLTWCPQQNKLIQVTASLHDNGLKPVLKIQMSDGSCIRVTENHPVMLGSLQWELASNLRVGDSVVALNHLEVRGTTSFEQLPLEEAEILGYLFAGRVHRNESVVVRKLRRSYKWAERRQQLFEAAGWTIKNHGKHAQIVEASPEAAMSPAIFLASLAKIKHGWPVDFTPEVWAAPAASVCRVLSGYFAASYFHPSSAEKLEAPTPLSATYGVLSNRVPYGIGHICPANLEAVRKLLLRVGATASIRVQTHRTLPAGTYGGVFPPRKSSRCRPETLLSLRVETSDVCRFWPTHEAPFDAPKLLKKVLIRKITRSVTPQQTWGVEIEEQEHSYIQQGILVHNTNQIAIGHVLWRIGKNPNCSIAIVCNTSEMAERTVSAIKQYIAYSQEFKDVFPDTRPGEVWASTKFTVSRETIRRDPTLQAVGLTGNIVGARLDGLVLDDVDNIDSTLTQAARDQTEQRIRKQVISRLDAAGWAVAIGNVWHENDLMHRLVRSGWRSMKFPILTHNEETGELDTRDGSMFPIERVYQIRDFDQGPVEFERLYMLKARIDGEQRFRSEWIDQALLLGKQQVLLREGVPRVPSGCRTISGVDLGIGQKAKHDPTVITTILEVPKGGEQYDYQILNIVKGRWNAQEIMDTVREQQRLFASEIWIESNGGQDFLIQLMNMSGMSYKVNAFRTGMNKYDPMFGVEAIAAEMALNKWYFPSWDGTREGVEQEMDELIEEMLAYQPGNHTGDILMSLWIARDGARQSRAKSQGKVEFGRLRIKGRR